MGQIMHTDSTCNDNFKVVLNNWSEEYIGSPVIVDWRDNRLPVFFDMEQSANVLALASWNRVKKVADDGIVERDQFGNERYINLCRRNPMHIISIERAGTYPSEHQLEEYDDNDAINKSGKIQRNWLFDAYHYCQADGSIMIPLYNFTCGEGQK